MGRDGARSGLLAPRGGGHPDLSRGDRQGLCGASKDMEEREARGAMAAHVGAVRLPYARRGARQRDHWADEPQCACGDLAHQARDRAACAAAHRRGARLGLCLGLSRYRGADAVDHQGPSASAEKGGTFRGDALCRCARLHADAARARELLADGARVCDPDRGTVGGGARCMLGRDGSRQRALDDPGEADEGQSGACCPFVDICDPNPQTLRRAAHRQPQPCLSRQPRPISRCPT